MKILNVLIILIAFTFCGCTAFQYADTGSGANHRNQGQKPFHQEPGKCYAKCLITNQYDQIGERYAVYTGDENEEDVDVKDVVIELQPASTKWVKKKADRNCRSADPNDCLVWCLVETKAEIIEFKMLVDTSQSDNYEMKSFYKGELVQEGGYTEWREVLCGNKVTANFIRSLNEALVSKGYEPEVGNNTLSPKTKAALSQFQKENKLPVGNLDRETLAALGL